MYSFINFAQNTQLFVITSFIENIETNLRIGKHTLRVVTWYFEEIFGKGLFRSFIYVFVSICCIRVTFNDLCCGLLSRTFKDNAP